MTDINDALTSLKRNQYLLYLMVFTLVVVVLWLIMGLIGSQRRPGISAELQQLATPLNPNLDADALDRIEAMSHFSSGQLGTFPIYKLATSADGRTTGVVTIDQDSRVFDLRLPDENLLIEPATETEAVVRIESDPVQGSETVEPTTVTEPAPAAPQTPTEPAQENELEAE